jgi:hypothetical protein
VVFIEANLPVFMFVLLLIYYMALERSFTFLMSLFTWKEDCTSYFHLSSKMQARIIHEGSTGTESATKPL